MKAGAQGGEERIAGYSGYAGLYVRLGFALWGLGVFGELA